MPVRGPPTRRLALADDVLYTMLDIKETVDQHTETLAAIQQTQAQHGGLLVQHGEPLAEILRRLGNSTSD